MQVHQPVWLALLLLELSLAMSSKPRQRIVVELDEHASQRQHRELGAFVRYCVFRLEREFGELEWRVSIKMAAGGFTSSVAVNDQNTVVEARGRGFDGALAAWEALNKLEEALRATRAHGISFDRTPEA